MHAGRLLERQLSRARRPRWSNDLAMLAVVAMFAWMAGPQLIDPFLAAVWLAAVALNPLSRFWLPRLARGLGSTRAITPGLVCLQALTTALLFIAMTAWLFLRGNDELRMLLGTVTAGVLFAEALTYACLPPAGLVWLGTLVSVSLLTLAQIDRGTGAAASVAVLIYAAIVARDMLSTSREFVERCLAEFEAERQTQMVELLLSDFEDASRDWFWECDADGRLTHASARLAEALGQPEAGLLGTPLVAALTAANTGGRADLTRAIGLLGHRFDSRRPFRDVILPLQTPAGIQWRSISGKPLLSGHGDVIGWRGVGVDVTAAQIHRHELERLATLDSLTGLANRHAFNHTLDGCFNPAGPAQPVSLLILDLDAFKAINDAHGHGVGDRLLGAVARRLEKLRVDGGRLALARLGGDEFALLLAGGDNPQAVADACRRILEHLRHPFLIGDLRLDVRTSAGLAFAPAHARNRTDLLRCADMALYAAKMKGRNTLAVFDEEIRARVSTRLRRTHELSEAIHSGGLEVYYQPVFAADGGRPMAAEALLRWRHPDLGLLTPAEFLELAEESGLIVPIGLWVLRQACTDAMGWARPLRVAVNLSVRQLNDLGLVEAVRRTLADSGLPASRLELEITESTLADRRIARRVLEALRALDVQLALDDFGTGFSSLSYLQHFGFDRLKIDRAFVQPLLQPGSQATAMLRAVIGLARALRLQCTAEGIEDPFQLRALRELGCDAFQGYLLGRPVTSEALNALLTEPDPLAAPVSA